MKLAIVSPRSDGALGVSLARGFEEAGHEVVMVPAAASTQGNGVLVRARRMHAEAPLSRLLTRRVAARVRPHSVDAVLVVKGRFIRAPDVRWLRRALGAPIANYYPDHPVFPDSREEPIVLALREYDAVLLWSDLVAEASNEEGIRRTAVVPFGYDPATFTPRPKNYPYRHDAVFVGQWYPVRERLLATLTDVDLIISGSGWARATAGTPLAKRVMPGRHFGQDAAAMFWSARVGINILHDHNLVGHNMRSWELPATATATVATWTADHEQMYGSDGAILFKTSEELVRGIRELLADDARRAGVASAGRQAVAHGTYCYRAKQIYDHLAGLSA